LTADWRLTIGAQPGVDGVRFRVWAPAAERVDVVLYGPSEARIHPLGPEGDGYFAGLVADARPGSLYQYRIDGKSSYPDPASRSQPEGLHGSSEVIDPADYDWRVQDPPSTPLDELVIYELHIGAFTPEGSFDSAAARLGEIAELGINAVEVMPIADFPGRWGWGYDGVNLFAPARIYGGVQGFKRFVDAAHAQGLSVILDVVYNHLGPEGNYIPAITGGRFFSSRHTTPWGEAINVDGPDCGPVRDFLVQNALYWLTEYRVDGLRLDATHAIIDDSEYHILAEIVDAVGALPGRAHIVIAEDDRNEPRLIQPRSERGFGIDAVWADDLHHQIRRAVAGDTHGYFARYSGTTRDIVETLRRGWWRPPRDDREESGPVDSEMDTETEPILALPPARFVHCIQNHDQVGNRATGERLNHEVPAAVFRAISALLLISPYTPLLWMGQEWAASSPFQYFTDHPPELGQLVSQGRREEFKHFPSFTDDAARELIPDPQAESTFLRSKLIWEEREEMAHGGVLALYRSLLELRMQHPTLRTNTRESFAVISLGEASLAIRRSAKLVDLVGVVNLRGEIRFDLGASPVTAPRPDSPWRPVIVTEEPRFGGTGAWGTLESDGLLHLITPGAILLASGG
jgi:maltooligosyltrehalose trehalohydrolase